MLQKFTGTLNKKKRKKKIIWTQSLYLFWISINFCFPITLLFLCVCRFICYFRVRLGLISSYRLSYTHANLIVHVLSQPILIINPAHTANTPIRASNVKYQRMAQVMKKFFTALAHAITISIRVSHVLTTSLCTQCGSQYSLFCLSQCVNLKLSWNLCCCLFF